MVAEFGDTRKSRRSTDSRPSPCFADARLPAPLPDPESHHQIHAGMDRYSTLLSSFRADRAAYDPAQLRAVMDSFRDVLHRHLDQEVADLGKDNMMKYVRRRVLSCPCYWSLTLSDPICATPFLPPVDARGGPPPAHLERAAERPDGGDL